METNQKSFKDHISQKYDLCYQEIQEGIKTNVPKWKISELKIELGKYNDILNEIKKYENLNNPKIQLTFEEAVNKIANDRGVIIEYPVIKRDKNSEDASIVNFNIKEQCFYIDEEDFNENHLYQIVRTQYYLKGDKDQIYKDFVKMLNK